MVGILVHGNNHFILSGPSPDEAARWHWCGTGPSSKLARRNRRLSGSGRLGRKSFERIWNGQSLSPAIVRPLQEWRNYLANFQLAGYPSGDCLTAAGRIE